MSVQEFTLKLRHKGDDVTVYEETLRVPMDLAPEALYKIFLEAQDVAELYQAFNHPKEPFKRVTRESVRAEENQRKVEEYFQRANSKKNKPVEVKCEYCYQPFTSQTKKDLHEQNFHAAPIESREKQK